jgi:hypothetical protein
LYAVAAQLGVSGTDTVVWHVALLPDGSETADARTTGACHPDGALKTRRQPNTLWGAEKRSSCKALESELRRPTTKPRT